MRAHPPRGRDRAAEIDAAVDAVVDDDGPVRITSGKAARRIIFAAPRRAGSDEVSDDVPDERWQVFGGAVGEVHAEGDTLWIGLGQTTGAGAPSQVERARSAGRCAAARLDGGRVAVSVPHDDAGVLAAAVDGLADGYTSRSPVDLVVDDPGLREAATQGLLCADVARLARLLVNAPAALLTPERMANWAREIADRAGLRCTVRGREELAAEGFGGVLAIGGGSAEEPRLVDLAAPRRDAPTVTFVGKGITFDSGGLSLKSPAAMQSMRLDVAGAATALAVLAAVPRLNTRYAVRAVLPLAENLPGPRAVRPGDVVTSWNGTEVQVLDTDFEGRVVLADALALAAADDPDLLVDLATLTYQAEIALGPEIAAVFGRDAAAVERWLAAARRAGEPMWQLPWAERYLDQVRTPSGVRNHPLRDSGRAITAALFLGEFVPRHVPWVHCDMAGPSWHGDASGDNATGFAARTMLELLRS